jgi:hypothetical protein
VATEEEKEAMEKCKLEIAQFSSFSIHAFSSFYLQSIRNHTEWI